MCSHPGDAVDDREPVRLLLENLHTQLPSLERLLDETSGHWDFEDPVYRFYHQSLKVYGLQATTERIVDALGALAPDAALNASFATIVRDGTGKKFSFDDNQRWLAVTRPIVEAFFHARFFLEMAVHYGRELKTPPQTLPSGWAALLYLFNLR